MRALGLALIGGLAAFAAEASPRRERPDPALDALREAATGCFAHNIRSSRRAVEFARGDRWYEAAGLAASLCRPEVNAMVRRHDELYGYGSGHRYFTGPYVRTLEKALAARLGPVLEASAVPAESTAAEKP